MRYAHGFFVPRLTRDLPISWPKKRGSFPGMPQVGWDSQEKTKLLIDLSHPDSHGGWAFNTEYDNSSLPMHQKCPGMVGEKHHTRLTTSSTSSRTSGWKPSVISIRYRSPTINLYPVSVTNDQVQRCSRICGWQGNRNDCHLIRNGRPVKLFLPVYKLPLGQIMLPLIFCLG